VKHTRLGGDSSLEEHLLSMSSSGTSYKRF